jgi:hypothetical protein
VLQFCCPSCAHKTRLPASLEGKDLAGKRVHCSRCGLVSVVRGAGGAAGEKARAAAERVEPPEPPPVAVPSAAGEARLTIRDGYFRMACPGCGQVGTFAQSAVGASVACPACSAKITISPAPVGQPPTPGPAPFAAARWVVPLIVLIILAVGLVALSEGIPGCDPSGKVNVHGYYRKDGSYVAPYQRSAPGGGGGRGHR